MPVVLALLLLLLVPAVSDAAVRRVQGCSAHNLAADNTVSCTMPAPTAAGNAIIVGAGSGNAARVLNTITITGGGTCAIDTPKQGTGTGAIYVGSCLNTTAGTLTITLTWDALLNAFIVAEEYTGVEVSGAFDVTGTSTGTTSPCTATSDTTTKDTELVFGFCRIDVDSTTTAGSGCTQRQHLSPATGDGWISVDKNVTAIGAQTCSMTMTDTEWKMITATYRASSGYLLTEVTDCINAETSDRLITEDVSAGTGPCVAAGAATPLRTLQGVGI